MKHFFKKLLSGLGYKLVNTKYGFRSFDKIDNVLFLNFDHVISSYILEKDRKDFNFIQIGAFDGVMHDPLRKYIVGRKNWKGIMVEPQPGPFKKLRSLYGDNPDITLLNCVISADFEKKALYVIDQNNNTLPDWIRGSASFNRNNLTRYADALPGLERHIAEVWVDSMSMDELIKINGDRPLDLLQIDAEGYDGELLKMFPFQQAKPAIIHFECKNLSKAELGGILEMLVAIGYDIAFDGGQHKAEDMIAVLKKVI